MVRKKMLRVAGLTLFVCPALLNAALCFAASQVINRGLQSKSLSHSKIGTDPLRQLAIYLPPGYESSSKRYPVLYYLPNAADNYRAAFDQQSAEALFDRAIENGVIGEFILVSVDMTTPLGCSWYLDSPVTGNWEDFAVRELVPYIDGNFRTVPNRDSRGIVGDRMGGYGAIRLAMRHPEVFGSVYALHPVATSGPGIQTMYSRPNWEVLAQATSLDDVKKDMFSAIFLSIFEAFLPDPEKPPLYTDLPAYKAGDQLVIDSELTARLRDGFLLGSMIPAYAENLKSLRGFKFDWGRSDTNHDHVYGNQSFTHLLNEFGIPHEAEEYNGGWGDKNWGENGRIYTDVLPFFQEHMVFEAQK